MLKKIFTTEKYFNNSKEIQFVKARISHVYSNAVIEAWIRHWTLIYTWIL